MNLPKKTAMMQFLKFGIVGISNTFLSLLIYYIFIWIDENLYLIGNIVGWLISVANAFFWNNKYVFMSESSGRRGTLKKIGKTYFSYGATFLISTGMLYLEIDILHWSAVISPILNLAITIPLNFLLNKFWAFR